MYSMSEIHEYSYIYILNKNNREIPKHYTFNDSGHSSAPETETLKKVSKLYKLQ